MADLLTYTVYLSTLLVSVIFAKSAFYRKRNRKNTKSNLIFCGLSLLVLILVAGLRYNTGEDYEAYAYLYEEVVNVDDTSYLDLELGFIVLVEILNSLKLKVWSFFIASAFLTYFLLFFSFKNYKSLLYLGIFFFIANGFYLYSFNGVRQAIAMSALAVAIMYAQERKIVYFFAVIILGALMHKSLLLFLPFYFFIHRIKLSSYFWYIAFGISLVLHFIPFENVVNLDLLANLISGTEIDYGGYATNFGNEENGTGSLTLGYLVRVCIGFFILTYYSRLIKINPNYLPYFTLSLIGIILYNSFSHILIVTRVNYYFSFFSIFSLAFIVHYLYRTKQNLFANAVLTFFVILFLYGVYLGENGASPYQFINF